MISTILKPHNNYGLPVVCVLNSQLMYTLPISANDYDSCGNCIIPLVQSISSYRRKKV